MKSIIGSILCVVLNAAAVYAQPAQCQSSADALAFPNRPFQATVMVQPPDGPRQGDNYKERLVDALRVPSDRFAIVQSVSLKGTHPENAYFAVELRSTVAWGLTALTSRHFLYARDSQSLPGRAISVFQPLDLYAWSNTPIQIGVQTSANASAERLAVTVTGILVDKCRWGK